jgi:hypothetical protein
VIRLVSYHKGEDLVRAHRAKRVYDSEDNLAGYQMLSHDPEPQILRSSNPSSCAFSLAEVEAIVGIRGESRTEHLPEYRRLSRLQRLLPEMDLVEAAKVKLSHYRSVQ